MSPTKKIKVEDVEITIFEKPNEADYISLTDMARIRGKESRTEVIIQNWMRLRDTVEYLGLWESVNNPFFKHIESMCLKTSQEPTDSPLPPKNG